MDLQSRKSIADAIRISYKSKELYRALLFGFGMRASDHLNMEQGYINILDELVEWFDQEGKLLEVLALLYQGKPGNPELAATANQFGITVSPGLTERFDTTTTTPDAPASLEALVAASSLITDVQDFKRKFDMLTARVCRIEAPSGRGSKLGTGFLVGPDLVLTNYHVLEDVITQGGAGRDWVRFWFDHVLDTAPTLSCGLAADGWHLSSSPYSASDTTGTGTPDDGTLDYALLRLDQAVGTVPVAGGTDPRGWFELKTSGRQLVTRHDVVLVVQHPVGKPMRVAWGVVVEFAGEGRRVRYNVTTDEGSSGSPCLTADLIPFALHHAAEPTRQPRYNQGIPLSLIWKDAHRNGGLLE